ITFGTGFFFNVTGNNSGIVCPLANQWACVLDASNNGSAGTITLAGVGSFATGIKMIGGRMNKQTGNTVILSGKNGKAESNWVAKAGHSAFPLSSVNQASVRYNVIDQSGSAAINVNSNVNGSTVSYNEIAYNLARDANVNVLQNSQGTIGITCSA